MIQTLHSCLENSVTQIHLANNKSVLQQPMYVYVCMYGLKCTRTH